jgi:hypothetical protein
MTDPGPRMDIHDGRVSGVIKWVWSLIGAGIIGATLLAANNLYQLNVTVARAADVNYAQERRLDDHEGRIRQMERDVSQIEGKVFRGVDGYQEPVKPRGPNGH